MKLSKKSVLILSGFFMLASGGMLISKAAHYFSLAFTEFLATSPSYNTFLFMHMQPLISLWDLSPEVSLALIMALATFVGLMKGRMVMGKVVDRSVAHVDSLGGSVPLWRLFPVKSLMLIGSMMLLGMLFNRLSLPFDVRGAVDMAIGVALIRGALFFFRRSTASIKRA